MPLEEPTPEPPDPDELPPWRTIRRTLAGWLHLTHPEPPTLETK